MSESRWITMPFALTVAVSSAALFILQPMCARMVLPHLGGSPGVWTTCMLFFQAGLLGGYVYAHACGRVGVRIHAVLHMILVALACAFLPPQGNDSPVVWLLATLFAAIGLPYLVLASSAPLLQVWFARSGSDGKGDPYFLYAASNVGSLLGLLSYPFLLEPLLGVRQQSYFWSFCFVLFAVLTSICALIVWRSAWNLSPPSSPRAHEIKARKAQLISRGTIVKWLFLAFLPSTLLLGVTVHLTADVASLPFLWIVPLGVYLMTYVVAFSPRGASGYHFWLRWLPLVVLVIVIVLLTEATEPLLLIVFLHLLGLFWIGMVCHGELARTRPPIENLTTFYLCIAVGGALGGAFNALLAPAMFDSLAEYPAALVLACVVPAIATSHARATKAPLLPQWKWDVLLAALLALVTCGLAFAVHRAGIPRPLSVGLIFGVPLVVCYTFAARPIRFGLGIAALLLSSRVLPGVHGESEKRVRSFFGVHRVTHNSEHRVLVHGNTEHGRQSLDPAHRGEPLSYYSRSGPVGELIGALSPADRRLQNVAVLGLGAGALAAYAQPEHHWTFHEIDPAVIRLAWQDFPYLQDAVGRGAKINVVPGDARLQISRTRDKYGLIILDAFSSDSIPVHLFTREAISIYRDRLTETASSPFITRAVISISGQCWVALGKRRARRCALSCAKICGCPIRKGSPARRHRNGPFSSNAGTNRRCQPFCGKDGGPSKPTVVRRHGPMTTRMSSGRCVSLRIESEDAGEALFERPTRATFDGVSVLDTRWLQRASETPADLPRSTADDQCYRINSQRCGRAA